VTRAQTRGDAAQFDRRDRMRRTRHAVFYDTSEVSRFELDGALSDADALIDHAARFVLAQAER
jgi:hypothetical protein